MTDLEADRPRKPRKRRRRSRAQSDEAPARAERRERPGDRQQPAPPTGWRDPGTRLGASAAVFVAGLAFVGLGPSELGAGLTLLGAAAFFYSIHKYGRLGPDEGHEPR